MLPAFFDDWLAGWGHAVERGPRVNPRAATVAHETLVARLNNQECAHCPGWYYNDVVRRLAQASDETQSGARVYLCMYERA